MAIRTAYELKNAHMEKHPNSHYFDSETLKFFGESMSTMRVLKNTAKIKDVSGDMHTCYILSKRSKGFNGKYTRKYDYFDTETLSHVIT